MFEAGRLSERCDEERRAPNWGDIKKPIIPTYLVLHSTAAQRKWKGKKMSVKRESLIREWLWSEVVSVRRRQKMNTPPHLPPPKKMLWAAKVQLVWYMMWDPNICLQKAGFFSVALTLTDEGPRSDSTAAPQQSGCGYTTQTSGPFHITLRNHEVRGRLFLPWHKGVIFHSPRENSRE